MIERQHITHDLFISYTGSSKIQKSEVAAMDPCVRMNAADSASGVSNQIDDVQFRRRSINHMASNTSGRLSCVSSSHRAPP